jgi:DNA-binding NarL/FixJ family response regulator
VTPSGEIESPRAGKAKLLLVDDHPIIREGLIQILSAEPDLEVCGETGDAREAVLIAQSLQPDLAVIDLSLAEASGLDLLKDIRIRSPKTSILVLSMHDEELYAERVIRAGARGYVMKGERSKVLLEAVRKVLAGGIYLSEAISSRLLEKLVTRAPRTASPLDALSDRELRVFQLIGKGLGPAQIAEALHLSVKTIETYRAHIKEKLGLPDAAALRHKAIQWLQEQLGR